MIGCTDDGLRRRRLIWPMKHQTNHALKIYAWQRREEETQRCLAIVSVALGFNFFFTLF